MPYNPGICSSWPYLSLSTLGELTQIAMADPSDSSSDSGYDDQMTYTLEERMQNWIDLREERAARLERRRLANLALFERISDAKMRYFITYKNCHFCYIMPT